MRLERLTANEGRTFTRCEGIIFIVVKVEPSLDLKVERSLLMMVDVREGLANSNEGRQRTVCFMRMK